MIEIKGNLWDLWDDIDHGGIYCITTNLSVKNNGKAVMGAGIAKEARDKFSGIDWILGQQIIDIPETLIHIIHIEDPLQIGDVMINPLKILVSFPVKYNWYDAADIGLIKKSCKELLEVSKIFTNFDSKELGRYAGISNVILPRPGCGLGLLDWNSQVKSVMEKALPFDIFKVITFLNN